jgi:hypothetical protein
MLVGKQPKPCAICPRCAFVAYPQRVSRSKQCPRCFKFVAPKYRGALAAADAPTDWIACRHCSGAGRAALKPCPGCNGVGWLFARNRGLGHAPRAVTNSISRPP